MQQLHPHATAVPYHHGGDCVKLLELVLELDTAQMNVYCDMGVRTNGVLLAMGVQRSRPALTPLASANVSTFTIMHQQTLMFCSSIPPDHASTA